MNDWNPSVSRAANDYLSHSRSRALYASEMDYERADDRWWEILLAALEREMPDTAARIARRDA